MGLSNILQNSRLSRQSLVFSLVERPKHVLANYYTKIPHHCPFTQQKTLCWNHRCYSNQTTDMLPTLNQDIINVKTSAIHWTN